MGIFSDLLKEKMNSPSGKKIRDMISGTNKNKYLSALTDDDEFHFYKRNKDSIHSFVLDMLKDYMTLNSWKIKVETYYFFIDELPVKSNINQNILIRVCDKIMEKIITIYNVSIRIGYLIYCEKNESFEANTDLLSNIQTGVDNTISGSLKKEMVKFITQRDVFYPSAGNTENGFNHDLQTGETHE
jgi:hypothetical protein